MTTYNFTGYRIATSDGTTSAVESSAFSLVTSDTIFLRYALDATPVSGFAPITITPSVGNTYSADINGTRIVLNDTASVAQYSWGAGKLSQLLMFEVPGEPGVMHIFQMGGNPIPALSSIAAYDAFMATVTQVDPTFGGTFRPGVSIDPGRLVSLTSETQNDVLFADADLDNWGTTQLRTGVGNDFIQGRAIAERIDAGDGNDSVNGSGGNDSIAGGNGFDTLTGDSGNDTVSGGGWNDFIAGGAQNDRLYGGTGYDTVVGGADADRLNGDDGNDNLYGGSQNDSLYGGIGNDYLDGGSENDLVYGGYGNDSVHGYSGNDTLHAGAGNDIIYGGTGNDSVTGYTGSDAFYFSDFSDADVITDFINNIDEIWLNENLGVTTAAQALTFATVVGANVVFDFGGGDVLTVRNTGIPALLDDIVIL